MATDPPSSGRLVPTLWRHNVVCQLVNMIKVITTNLNSLFSFTELNHLMTQPCTTLFHLLVRISG